MTLKRAIVIQTVRVYDNVANEEQAKPLPSSGTLSQMHCHTTRSSKADDSDWDSESETAQFQPFAIRARPQYEQVTSSSTSKVVISNPTLPGPTGSDRDCTCTQHVRPRTTTSIGRASRAQAPRELFPPHACENCTYGNRIGRARRGAYVSPARSPHSMRVTVWLPLSSMSGLPHTAGIIHPLR